jgi:hypothetical protein
VQPIPAPKVIFIIIIIIITEKFLTTLPYGRIYVQKSPMNYLLWQGTEHNPNNAALSINSVTQEQVLLGPDSSTDGHSTGHLERKTVGHRQAGNQWDTCELTDIQKASQASVIRPEGKNHRFNQVGIYPTGQLDILSVIWSHSKLRKKTGARMTTEVR